MTVSSGAAKAGPYTGNDLVSSFAFSFKVFADSDIRVVETLISTEVETDLVLNTNYTVTRNADQDVSPGGTITYKVGGVTAVLPNTKKLTIVGDFDYEQPTDIPNGGAFFAPIVENALDRLTLQIKQLKEKVDRAVAVGVSSSQDPDTMVDDFLTAVAEAEAAAASAAAAWDSFDDRYLGPKASDPSTDNDGAVLTSGVFYWNTTTGTMRVYNGSAWADAITATPSNLTADTFSGTGAQTAFTLSAPPSSVQACIVFIAGVRQRPTTDYTVSGTTLTFTTAPVLGANNVSALTISALSIGTPADNTVTTAKLADANVTLAKLQSISTSTLLGRSSAGTGAPEQLTLGAGLALSSGVLSVSGAGVRQTVQAAVVDTSGQPNYLPATSSGTTLTSTGISSTAPIVVNAAGGGGSTGLADRGGVSSSNLVWTGLTVTNGVKNYLYVDVAANGALTTGSTTVAPVYQQGGTPAVTSGLFTFNYGEMRGYLGNGSTAPQAYRVYVGEGTGNGTNVASIIAYALNGQYVSGEVGIALATVYSFAHNLGASSPNLVAKLVCKTTDSGYAVGSEVSPIPTNRVTSDYGASLFNLDPNNARCITAATALFVYNATTGVTANITLANWKIKIYADRGFK